jgi:hypothetical protein
MKNIIRFAILILIAFLILAGYFEFVCNDANKKWKSFRDYNTYQHKLSLKQVQSGSLHHDGYYTDIVCRGLQSPKVESYFGLRYSAEIECSFKYKYKVIDVDKENEVKFSYHYVYVPHWLGLAGNWENLDPAMETKLSDEDFQGALEHDNRGRGVGKTEKAN